MRSEAVLLYGPDVGSSRHPETLHSGESQHFPFRVNAHGTVRSVLEYRPGQDENLCVAEKENVSSGRAKSRSNR